MSDTVTPPVVTPPVAPPPPESGHPWWGSPAVAIYSLTIFIACLVIAYLKGSDTLLTTLLGVAAANATTAVNYYLGSSSGSATKDQVLHSIALNRHLPPS